MLTANGRWDDHQRWGWLHFNSVCIDLIERGLVDVGKLITHRFTLEDMQQAMSAVRDDKQTVGKVLMVRE